MISLTIKKKKKTNEITLLLLSWISLTPQVRTVTREQVRLIREAVNDVSLTHI